MAWIGVSAEGPQDFVNQTGSQIETRALLIAYLVVFMLAWLAFDRLRFRTLMRFVVDNAKEAGRGWG